MASTQTSDVMDRALNGGVVPEVHVGAFGVYAEASIADWSASDIYLMIPLPDRVQVLDGWIKTTGGQAGAGSGSFDVKVGTPDDDDKWITDTELLADTRVWFEGELGHVVTLTDSDTFPRMKPLIITVVSETSGSAGGLMQAFALLQNGPRSPGL